MTGLEDQLLVDVVKNERPDLEAKKDELVSTPSTSKLNGKRDIHVCLRSSTKYVSPAAAGMAIVLASEKISSPEQ